MSKLLAEGKRVLVTGGSRGLGLALVERYAAEGAKVAFTYTRDEATAEAARKLAGEHGRAYRVSVLDPKGTTAMVNELEAAWGGLDVLVNNAGLTHNLPLALLEEEDFDEVMDVNVKGAFLTSKAVLRGMIRRRGGVVLFMSSLAGVRMLEAPIHYCASKAALVGLSDALSKEVSRYGVRVLCLAPGLLEDGLGKNLPDARLRDYLHHCSLGRVGTFREVADWAVFLTSAQNGYMNGTTVVLDGGV